jgi:hypothetical protein
LTIDEINLENMDSFSIHGFQEVNILNTTISLCRLKMTAFRITLSNVRLMKPDFCEQVNLNFSNFEALTISAMEIVNITLKQEQPLFTIEGRNVLITQILILDSQFAKLTIFQLDVS